MPGFIDTHHHQFETALRSFLADGVLINDGPARRAETSTYFEYILLKFAPVYRPQDVYINELFGALSQLDDGVTTVHDISQIHHSPAALRRRHPGAHRYRAAAPPSAISRARARVAGNKYPDDAVRIKKQWFSSSDQLVTMIMGGEVYLAGLRRRPGRSGASSASRSRRTSSRRSASARSSTCSPQGQGGDSGKLGLGPDNLFIHMTGMSDMAWQKVKDVGRAGLARRPDRNEHAARHAADPQDAEPGHGAVAERRTWSAR